ncbi:MAG: patatin family protein [Acidaminococcaceae bacterium]|nr:patatin family protein [Acidaminococcaceae bacterium]
MTLLKNTGLVLEGGGMRGMFSAGVFEAFMQEEVEFPYATAVSAGACNVVSYLSKQPLRTRRIIDEYVADSRYCSLGNLLRTGSLFGFDFILKEIPQKLLPFDYDAFYRSPCELYVGATDCKTGDMVWFPKEAMGSDFEPLRASSSLPFLAPVVKIDGYELMDGGLADPIPVEKAMADGYERNVIVLTRNPGYYSTENYPLWLLKLWYAKYPKLIEVIRTRSENYNRQMALAEKLEAEGRAVIIRPLEPLTIGRLDRKPQELLQLHDHGTDCALTLMGKIRRLAQE